MIGIPLLARLDCRRKKRTSNKDVRTISTSRYESSARISIWLALCLAYAVTTSYAQKPTRPVDSSLMTQLRQAISMAQHGNENQALALTSALLEKHPDFVPALKLQGMLLENAGHNSEAWLSYQKAFKLAPNDAELLLKIGVYRLIAGENDQAITLLLHRLKLLPLDGDSLYYLAQAYHLKGDDELALRAIRECVKVEPDNASVWQKYGEILCSSGDNEAALRWLLKAQQSDPTLERIDYDIGVTSYYNMDLANALKYAARAAQIQPNDPHALALLAAVKLRLSQWQDAKAIFERILVLKKDDVPSLLGLGHCELDSKIIRRQLTRWSTCCNRIRPRLLRTFSYQKPSTAWAGRTKRSTRQTCIT